MEKIIITILHVIQTILIIVCFLFCCAAAYGAYGRWLEITQLMEGTQTRQNKIHDSR
jgi:hypothetical protein